ncbi:MAG: ECF transporter S component [Evtepia sp.]|uniref:ECF transporter S component n=1 Tax=Evtepia sp. TaxID=2773933 RepID=UPI002A748D84|nr:ECF transporter S component [Evtepia sp.]MDY3013738.1 ECF transporter S component [Evtepia sp.]
MNQKIRKLVVMAMLVALSIVLVYVVHFPIFPAAPFLEYDPADIPILIGTFAFGPLAGVMLTVVTSLIQGFTVSAQSGVMGIAMHIFATSTLVLVAGNIYRLHRTKKGAVVALVVGTLAMTMAMVVFNYFITPYFITPDISDAAAVAANRGFVATLLVPVIVPFNLIKAGVNSVITFVVYKTVSRHLIHGESWKKHTNMEGNVQAEQ